MVLAYLADLRDVRPDHVVLHAAPLTHGSGIYALPALARGATQVITTSRSFDPDEILATVGRRGRQRHRLPDADDGQVAARRPIAAPAAEPRARRLRRGADLPRRPRGGARLVRPGPQPDLRPGRGAGHDHAPDAAPSISAGRRTARLLGRAGRAYTTSRSPSPATTALIAAVGEGELVTRSDVVMPGYWSNPAGDGRRACATAGCTPAMSAGIAHDGLGVPGRPQQGRDHQRRRQHLPARGRGGASCVHERSARSSSSGRPTRPGASGSSRCWSLGRGAIRERPGQRSSTRSAASSSRTTSVRVSYDWLDELPVSPYGKVLKREVRAPTGGIAGDRSDARLTGRRCCASRATRWRC